MNEGIIGFFLGCFVLLFIITHLFMVIDTWKINKYQRFLTDTKQWDKYEAWYNKKREQQYKTRF